MENCKYCKNDINNYIMHKPQCKKYKSYLNNILENILTYEYLNTEIILNNNTVEKLAENLDIIKSHIIKKCNIYNIPYSETKRNQIEINNKLTKEYLIIEYLTNNKSIKQIAKDLKTSTTNIRTKLIEYNIELKIDNIENITTNNNIENILTYDFLYNTYIIEGYSLKYIASLVGLKKTHRIVNKLKEYNINIRTIQEAKKQKHHIQLAKETSLEKYGVEYHLSKNSPLLYKAQETVKSKYGVDNIFQSEEIKDKIKKTNKLRYGAENVFSKDSIIKQQIQQEYYNKTGYLNPWSNPEVTKKCLDTKIKNNTNNTYYSKQSQEIFWKIYNLLPIELQQHTYFAELNKEFGKYDIINKKYYFYDFVITNINFCIEFNGNYYHANPTIYNENFYNKHLKLTAAEIWDKDKIKNEYLQYQENYKLYIIWESDDMDSHIKNIINIINELTINNN